MDIVDQITIPSFHERHRRRKRAIALLSSLVFAAGLAEYRYGAISSAYKRIKKACMVAIATLLEDNAGMPLITVSDDIDGVEGGKISALDLKKLKHRHENRVGSAEEHVLCATIPLTLGDSDGGGSSLNPSQHGACLFQQQQQQQEDPTPQFFQSTKFFAVLEQEEASELFNLTKRRHLVPGEFLFQRGEPSDDGIFIVIKGLLGVYLENLENNEPGADIHANTLRYGESVGDLDIVDGAPRTVTCRAMGEGCSLVQVPRDLFVSFCLSHPRALLLYLQQGLARLWRVANFMLSDFLKLPPPSCPHAAPPPSILYHIPTTASPPSSSNQSSLLTTRSLSLRSPNHTWSGSSQQMSSSPLPPSPGFKEYVNIASNPNPSNPSLQPLAADLPWGMGTPSKGAIEAAAKVAQGHLPASFMSSSPSSMAGGQTSQTTHGLQKIAASSLHHTPQSEPYPVSHACLANGWDVATREEVGMTHMDDATWSLLTDSSTGIAMPFPLAKGGLLQDESWACSQFYLLVEGELLAERRKTSAGSSDISWERAIVKKGSFISCAAFLSSTSCRCRVTASISSSSPSTFSQATGLASARLVSFGWQQLDGLADSCPQLLVNLLMSASVTMGPLIRRFISLGMNRVWLKSGDCAYRQDQDAESLYVIISGRIRLLHEFQHTVSGKIHLKTEEEVGRGEAIGAVWAITGGQHDSTSLCVRDSELVRMSKNSLHRISQVYPMALSSLFSNIAKRLTAARDSRMARDAKAGGGASRSQNPVGMSLRGSGTSTPVASAALTSSFSKESMASSHHSSLQSKPGSAGGKRGEIVTIAVLPSGLVSQQSGGMHWGGPLGRHNTPGAAGLLAVKRLASALKESLGQYGPCLQLNSTSIGLLFPAAFERLDVLFYRSKITSWLSSQEEEYRFIILEGDNHTTPWSSVCVAQADAILLVAAEGSQPVLGPVEAALVFSTSSPGSSSGPELRGDLTFNRGSQLGLNLAAAAAANLPDHEQPDASGPYCQWIHSSSTPNKDDHSTPQDLSLGLDLSPVSVPQPFLTPITPIKTPQHPSSSQHSSHLLAGKSVSAAQLRRTELVLLHSEASGDPLPQGTLEWLKQRPHLARHHHVRLGRHADIERLSRWMSGRANGLVLSGGGSRGLAHLGVLCALEDCGVPIDCIGGTSQGAFMAALYAQGLSREMLQSKVHTYASKMGSMGHLLRDLTLPLLSVFSGKGFDEAMRQCFSSGADQIEDLWIPFFCVTTNLTKGEPSIHHRGTLWRLVRASMTIVGLLPPVFEEGEGLLVDDGYMNNLPVDVMRSMGVDQVIVVDVEGKDESGWSALTSKLDGGVSGWRIFWDRTLGWLVPSWRSGAGDMPKYSQIINQLTWMTHAHNLKRVARDYKIDLYLRPPVQLFRLLDYHLYGRIVKQAYRYSANAIVEWQKSEEPEHPSLQQEKTAVAREQASRTQHFSWANASAASTSEHRNVNQQQVSNPPDAPVSLLPQPSPTLQAEETEATDINTATNSAMNDLLAEVLADENGTSYVRSKMARVKTTKTLQRLEEEEEVGELDGMSMGSLVEEEKTVKMND